MSTSSYNSLKTAADRVIAAVSTSIDNSDVTPLISNCFSTRLPPPLQLPPTDESTKSARFSSNNVEPIVMSQSIYSKDALCHQNQFMSKQKRRRQESEPFRLIHHVSACHALPTDESHWTANMLSNLVLLIEIIIKHALRQISEKQVARGYQHAPKQKPMLTPEKATTDGDGRIRGIPNLGNSCFLNSVLQALAALEPFVAYLQHITELEKDEDCLKLEPSFTESLLSLLLSINGAKSTDRIDTRHLLHSVGTKYDQFGPRFGSAIGREQQDAEELLQVLVDLIVNDAGLDTTSSMIAPSFVPKEMEDEEWLSTIVLSVQQKLKNKRGTIQNNNRFIMTNGHGPLQQLDKRCYYDDDIPLRREEKKQDEFQIYIPRVHSEEKLHICNMPVNTVHSVDHDNMDGMSDISSKDRHISAAMEIMLSTTSSINPSPLSGWCGSALRCLACNYMRPIQNTPFCTIPVVPTAVSRLISSVYCCTGEPPQKGPPDGHDPPCRLEECLDEFTSVERVHDVECRNCTLLAEIQNLEEEVEMLEGAASLKRPQLQEELKSARLRLQRMRYLNPDDEKEFDTVFFDIDHDLIESDPKLTISRNDANKCLLLTRLPSILCIHIQRRYYDPLRNRMTKTLQHVMFPEFLNLSPYCAYSGARRGTAWAGTSVQTNSHQTSRQIHYRIMAVIEHRGGAFVGHYVCYRRDTSTGRWLYISDEVVRTVDWQDVSRSQAYMLFYEAI